MLVNGKDYCDCPKTNGMENAGSVLNIMEKNCRGVSGNFPLAFVRNSLSALRSAHGGVA